MIAFIPLLCPWDDIAIGIILVLFPASALAIWLRKRLKWCKKDCGCKCHNKNDKLTK